MASCEHSRTRAYDEDLRWRIVYQHYALEYSNVRIADNMNIAQLLVGFFLCLRKLEMWKSDPILVDKHTTNRN